MSSLPLFIFEMANNHMGDVRHGVHIIEEFKKVADRYRGIFRFAFKLQLRHPSIIHPDYTNRTDISQIKRFSETRLSESDFALLKTEIEKQGFISMCTPFDEPSVDKMIETDFAMFKIASCSFGDWPLMEQFQKVDKPVILSTACADTARLDNVVSFFKNRKKDFALLHCVSSYPTENRELSINQISWLKNRYPGVPVGFSTHEAPDNDKSIFMAIAAGASIFEKHVGVPTEKYKLNGYSCTPSQVDRWLSAAKEAYEMLGGSGDGGGGRMTFSESAIKGVGGFTRSAFAARTIKKGETFTARDLFLAIPGTENQLTAFDLSKYASFTAGNDIGKNAPVFPDGISVTNSRDRIEKIARSVLAMLDKARIRLPGEVNCSVSAHYGLDAFSETGAVIIDVLNREYCKKLIVMHTAQKHPPHTHQKKEETFHVLHGDLHVVLDGTEHFLNPGDLLTVGRGQNHSFDTENGVIFEEISTTHYKNDSFYDDDTITGFSDRKIEFRLYS